MLGKMTKSNAKPFTHIPLSAKWRGKKKKKKVGAIQILVPLTKWQEAIAVEHLKIPRQYFM